ncbi:MAG: hypothetical protein QNJ44_22605 [Rhodobacter sp.]|nr:hypothetical protein [Rhodobacter sp.]
MPAIVICKDCGNGHWEDRECPSCRKSNIVQMKAARPAPKVRGVGRDSDDPRAIVAYFDRELTDDEMRFFHDCLRRWPSLT